MAVALLGEQTHYVGAARSAVYRWFTDPSSRDIYLPVDHDLHGRTFTAQLRQAAAHRGPHSTAADLAHELRHKSSEFTALWDEHQIGLTYSEAKRFTHPEVGRIDLHCQTLLDPTPNTACSSLPQPPAPPATTHSSYSPS